MEELQALRMSVMWPLVVGAAAFLAARSLFWLLHPRLTRDHAVACLVVAAAGAVVAWAIAVAWDNGPSFWLAFTVGLAIVALVLVMTCAVVFIEVRR